MNNAVRILSLATFFFSIIYLPWWVSLACALYLLAFYSAFVSVFVGAVLLDLVYGAPLHTFSGFSFLYTAIMTLLIVVTAFLQRSMLE